jgi:putative transcriptional regulator
MRATQSIHARNIESYRKLERTHRRWQTIRSRFGIAIRDAAFFIGTNKSHTLASLERQANNYFSLLLDYARLERTNDLLRSHRLQEGLGLGEAAFLFAGIEDRDPLPNKLRAARLRTGLSQKDVAFIIGKTRSVLSSYERGKRNPGFLTALSLSTLYDVALNKLFPQQVGALSACLKKRQRMLTVWRRSRQRPLASKVHGL